MHFLTPKHKHAPNDIRSGLFIALRRINPGL